MPESLPPTWRPAMKLAPGRFFGEVLCRRGGNGLTLNLARYQPGQDQPFHVHANPTFFVLIRGLHRDLTRRSGLDQEELSLAFHATNEPHASAVGPGGMLGMNLEYEPAWLERHGLAEKDLGGYRMLEPTVWSRLTLLRLLCAAASAVADAEEELHAGGLELLEPLLPKMRIAKDHVPPAWMRRAEEFLHAHFRTSVSLRDAARVAGVHAVYFARVFRERYGCTVSAYLRALRLVDAGRLVLRHGESLAGAAATAGFADQAHLTRCFKRQFGFTPRAVRVVRDAFGG
jgi:AraC family transcriptional regulator